MKGEYVLKNTSDISRLRENNALKAGVEGAGRKKLADIKDTIITTPVISLSQRSSPDGWQWFTLIRVIILENSKDLIAAVLKANNKAIEELVNRYDSSRLDTHLKTTQNKILPLV